MSFVISFILSVKVYCAPRSLRAGADKNLQKGKKTARRSGCNALLLILRSRKGQKNRQKRQLARRTSYHRSSAVMPMSSPSIDSPGRKSQGSGKRLADWPILDSLRAARWPKNAVKRGREDRLVGQKRGRPEKAKGGALPTVAVKGRQKKAPAPKKRRGFWEKGAYPPMSPMTKMTAMRMGATQRMRKP